MRGVSFDLDGTLYDYASCHRLGLDRAGRAARRWLGLDRARFLALYVRSREVVHRRLRGTAASHSRLLYFHEITAREGDRAALRTARKLEQAYWSGYYDVMEVFPGVIDLFRLLRKRSFRLALTTDMTTAIQCEKLERLGLSRIFDVVVTSEEAGYDKPNPAIFALSCRRLGLRPGDIVHVGDDYSRDVRGARSAGMRAIWFSPEASPGTAAMRTFGELYALL